MTIGRWRVVSKRVKSAEDGSGAFSSCYEVRDEEGNTGFLKAFNIHYAFVAVGRAMDRLKELTERFTYERDLLAFCRERKMRRVVAAIDFGEYQLEGDSFPIPYLVFEIAQGSLKTIDFLRKPDLAWRLRTFHGTLLGVSQLHQARIAHQDIKPSNVLIFGSTYSKVSDLGSASLDGSNFEWESPDRLHTDLRYAPIELLYGHYSQDWNTRRFGADLFMLGGLLAYMVSGVSVLSGILSLVPPEQHWRRFGGKFEEVLPNILMAFHEVLRNVTREVPESIREEVGEVLFQLSHPVPEERGNPAPLRNRVGHYSLTRYVSILDRLSKKIAMEKP